MTPRRKRGRPAPAPAAPARRLGPATIAVALVVVAGAAAIAISAMRSKPVAATTAAPATPPAAGSVFTRTVANASTRPGPAPEGMVWVPGGEFSMGAADPMGVDDNDVGMRATTDSRPIHRVYVDGFWMDATEVTNAQFAAF